MLAHGPVEEVRGWVNRLFGGDRLEDFQGFLVDPAIRHVPGDCQGHVGPEERVSLGVLEQLRHADRNGHGFRRIADLPGDAASDELYADQHHHWREKSDCHL